MLPNEDLHNRQAAAAVYAWQSHFQAPEEVILYLRPLALLLLQN